MDIITVYHSEGPFKIPLTLAKELGLSEGQIVSDEYIDEVTIRMLEYATILIHQPEMPN